MTGNDIFDPVVLCQGLWPDSYFYSKQRELLYSLRDAYETYVVAGNELGKDWILGRACLAFFISPWTFFGKDHFQGIEDRWSKLSFKRPEWITHQRKVITTSVKDEHLDVLWGEIGMAWRTCSIDLSKDFVMTHHEIRFRSEAEEKNASSYLKGQVSGSGNFEGLTGHHAGTGYTLGASDESSGADDRVHKAFGGWAKRQCFIGNPLKCHNFYKQNYKEGPLRIEEADKALLAAMTQI